MEEIDLIELLEYIKERLLFIAIFVFSFTLVVSTANYFVKKPLYKSDTTLLIVNMTNNKLQNADVTLSKNLIGTYSEIIKSRTVLETVKNNLKLKDSIESIASYINVSNVNNTELIKISVSSKDGEKSKVIADEAREAFSKKIREIYNVENIKTIDNAKLAVKPYNINYLKDTVIIFTISIVLSLSVVFVIYYFDNSIKNSEMIEDKFNIKVLGVIPEEGK